MSEPSPSGKSLLLVEDDEIVRGAMKMVLEWEGYHVACASNGREALELLQGAERPALIVLDLMMPVLDGWQLRRELRQDPHLSSIPVVVVSALDADASPEAAGHVQKPFQVEELLAVVRRQR